MACTQPENPLCHLLLPALKWDVMPDLEKAYYNLRPRTSVLKLADKESDRSLRYWGYREATDSELL